MAVQEENDCCLGRKAGDSDRLPQDEVWEACKTGVRNAIQEQLEDGLSPVVIDGLPTIGKTTAAANVVSGFDVPAAVFTHLHQTRNAHIENAADDNVDVVKLPSLEKTCPTACGEHGEELASQLQQYNERGASPKFLHKRLADELPRMQDGDCEYLSRWEKVSEADLLVGHPVHANLSEVVEDRVVIFDEDPEDAFRTKFTGTKLAKAVAAYLDNQDELSIDTLADVKTIASGSEFASIREKLKALIEDGERVERQSEALDANGGHAKAPAAILAILAFDTPSPDSFDQDEPPRTWGHLRERVGLEYADLPNGSAAVFDRREDTLYIRNSPDLSTARAVVGLDGTPTMPIWEGRLGFDDVASSRILCDSCRQNYLQGTVGYQIIQTTDSTNPYSSGTNANRRANFGLIEAIAARHETDLPVITTKKAEERLLESEPAKEYIYPNRVNERISACNHYGNLRSSNEFEGESVGVVLGSPHPGDRSIQVTAAFEGYIAIADREDGRGMDLSYGIDGDPFLHHYREHKVAQAIFRFGRTTSTVVYVHTAAMPKWLREMAVTPDESTVEINKRGEGMRAVMHSLTEDGAGTVQAIAEREAVAFSENHVRDMLKRLRNEGVVARNGNQPYEWAPNGIRDLPHTAEVTLPDIE